MRKFCCLAGLVVLLSCKEKEKADLLIHHATIYTVDTAFVVTEAMAVRDGKIIATGTSSALQERYDAAEQIDAKGKFIYPGLIDAHAHFYRYGLSLQTADLTGTSSWESIIEKLKAFAVTNREGWLTGRGWDQNDWAVKEFPTNDQLNTLFPNRPVLLTRIDGHAAIANQKALQMAGVQPGMQLTGGTVETKNGRLTGLLIDNAIGLVRSKVPPPDSNMVMASLLQAAMKCF